MSIAAAGAEAALRRFGGTGRVRRGFIAADVLSRSHIYPQPRGMLYRAPARIRVDGAVPPTHMLFRCSIARIRVHSGGRDRPAAEAVDALLRSRAYILSIYFGCSARRASQNHAKALYCVRAHIRPDTDGPPDR